MFLLFSVFHCCFTAALLLLYPLTWLGAACATRSALESVLSVLLLYYCFTAALLLLYKCFTHYLGEALPVLLEAVLSVLLLYCCFTTALLLLYALPWLGTACATAFATRLY